MKHRVELERGRKYVGLPEFASICERVVSDMDLEQQRGTVTSVPDERTIRYYLSEGLVQAPEERQGTASVFTYLNLLQIVAVKKLQAEHLPIRKIRDLVSGKSEQELEALLGIGEPAGKKGTDAKQYLESLLTGIPTPRESVPPTAAVKPAPAPSPPQVDSSAAAPGSWHRVEIEPGLELHIRSDYSPPASSARTRSLAERIRSIINKWRS
jgi:DNA-binding transcriptional MerR regulator